MNIRSQVCAQIEFVHLQLLRRFFTESLYDEEIFLVYSMESECGVQRFLRIVLDLSVWITASEVLCSMELPEDASRLPFTAERFPA